MMRSPALSIIHESGIKTLCRWYNSLNGWEWPEDMPGKPAWYDAAPSINKKTTGRYFDGEVKASASRELMHAIEKLVPRKELSRYWHVRELGKSNQQFERWWLSVADVGGGLDLCHPHPTHREARR